MYYTAQRKSGTSSICSWAYTYAGVCIPYIPSLLLVCILTYAKYYVIEGVPGANIEGIQLSDFFLQGIVS